ncbi:ribonuclease P protein component [Segniliparus rotundus DSM 44985]|uniref:Ribonuclease P protein component n=1 Tax=Segniliparus rotundus (strain ATCC BAA-972 / CDC 1076 / CIP 108378 / DSM 44985 / JCM 13578) TaxID=640132 RepID=D6ZEM2_SEGRD|nr:ribonuclease P protein component [Segniliparus rotundus]ADG99498.1 ribonuclease P protein component [Segniliparus rotundus DSM 44985]
MLPSHNRMRNRRDFAETVRSGRRVGRGDVVVHFLSARSEKRAGCPVAEPCAPRIGLVVGKQVGGSVTRKRVSRRLRAALGELLALVPQSSRLVVRALPAAAGAEVAELESQLRSALRKLAPATAEEKGPS